MPDEFSVKLCEHVQRYPEIYDILNKNYHNEGAKNNAWELVAQQLGVPKSKCVIKWKSLKHQFIKAKKEHNTEWDMWPCLQFCDDAAAVKGSRKRKRESAATPAQVVIAADDPASEVSVLSKTTQKEETMKATTGASVSTRFPHFPLYGSGVATTQSPQESFLSQIPVAEWRTGVTTMQGSQETFLSQFADEYWRTQASPSVPQFNNESPKPAMELPTIGMTGKRTARMQASPSAMPPFYCELSKPALKPIGLTGKRTARMQAAPSTHPFYSESSKLAVETGRRSVRMQASPSVPQFDNESSKPAVEPAPAKPTSRRAARNKESPKENVAASPTPVSQQATPGRTPRGRRSTASRASLSQTVQEDEMGITEAGELQLQQANQESSKKNVATSLPHSVQQVTASKALRGRRSSMRPIVAPEVIPEEPQASSSTAGDPLPERSGKESPKKNVIGSPPESRQQTTAKKAPRGRRSTARPVLAEAISEEQQDDKPSAKRARVEGNGCGADNEPDEPMGIEFDRAFDQKFCKRLQDKFAKLRPEVVSTMKANIFRMLDEAAKD